jgi:hypothetical protein
MLNKKALGIAMLSTIKLVALCVAIVCGWLLLYNFPFYGSLVFMFISLSYYVKVRYDIAIDEEDRKAKRF